MPLKAPDANISVSQYHLFSRYNANATLLQLLRQQGSHARLYHCAPSATQGLEDQDRGALPASCAE